MMRNRHESAKCIQIANDFRKCFTPTTRLKSAMIPSNPDIVECRRTSTEHHRMETFSTIIEDKIDLELHFENSDHDCALTVTIGTFKLQNTLGV